MNQSYVYEDDENEESITFKKIGYFFKKGWLRMLIYVAVLVALATAIAVPIKVFYKSEPVAQTSVEFIYEGIEEGKDPNGGTFNSGSIISPSVLSKAVAAADLGGIITDISKLRASMRVEGVETDEYVNLVQAAANGDINAANTLRNYTMYPTRFTIVISNHEGLGLNDAQAKVLLDKIVMSYYDDFSERYSVTNMFSSSLYNLSGNATIEFTSIYDTYTAALDPIKSYLWELAEKNPNFISTENNTSFSQLSSELNIIKSNYELFNAQILSKNIWRNKDTARNTLEASRDEINNKLTPLREYIVALNEQIASFQPNSTETGSGSSHTVTITYPPEYFAYHARLDEANRQVSDYEVQLANINLRLKKLESATAVDETVIASSTASLAALEAQTIAFVEKVNATIADFYNTSFISSSVRQVLPPAVSRRSSDFNLLVVYLVAILGGLLIASAVTVIKIMKANASARAAARNSSENAEVKADAEETADEKTKA